jgi:hypothetical protein
MVNMSETNPRDIAIANNAIAEAIKEQVKNEVDESVAAHTAFASVPELLESIKSMQDPEEQAELYKKYLAILEEHQKTKNEVLSKLVDNKIEKNNKVVDAEIQKDQARTALFANRSVLMFFMCFPIVVSLLIIVVSESFVFASFIILMWYGMILALYFSQSDALNKLLQNISGKNVPKI